MSDLTRRNILKQTAAVSSAGGLIGLSGCTGDDGSGDGSGDDGSDGSDSTDTGDDDETEPEPQQMNFQMAGPNPDELSCWQGDCPMTWSIPWEYMERLDEESDGQINGEFIGGSELCTSCYEEVESGVVAMGDGSFDTAANLYPEINLLMLPYTYPSYYSSHYAIFHSYMWEEYWIPFAQRYGVIPVVAESAQPKNLYVGLDYAGTLDGKITRPEQLDGADIRISGPGSEAVGIEALGATPVELAWGDTIQGMESGVVDGMVGSEAWAPWFGMGEVSDHVVKLDALYTEAVWFARVDWLKDLAPANRDIIASVSKRLSEQSHQAYHPWRDDVLGITSDPPPEGTGLTDTNTAVSLLSDGRRDAFRDTMGYQENPEMYAGALEPVYELVDDDGIVEKMIGIAEEETPGIDNFEFDSWWDEYLQEM